MIVYKILFSTGRFRKTNFNISKNKFIKSSGWGKLQFEKQMIKNQFEKKKSQIIFDEDMSLNEKLLTFLYYPLA